MSLNVDLCEDELTAVLGVSGYENVWNYHLSSTIKNILKKDQKDKTRKKGIAFNIEIDVIYADCVQFSCWNVN